MQQEKTKKKRSDTLNIKKNVAAILSNLKGQTIVAATKNVFAEEIKELVRLGITDIGENRVDDFLKKYNDCIGTPITWHFIGHLQTNKVKKIINKIDFLHSLDRMSLAEQIQKDRLTPLNCFIEVNISSEKSKTGMEFNEVLDFVKKMEKYDKIRIVGLMGMALNTTDSKVIEKSFLDLYNLQLEIQSLQLPFAETNFLSIGMSNDYLVAILCHSTHLRLGSILFRNEESYEPF